MAGISIILFLFNFILSVASRAYVKPSLDLMFILLKELVLKNLNALVASVIPSESKLTILFPILTNIFL